MAPEAKTTAGPAKGISSRNPQVTRPLNGALPGAGSAPSRLSVPRLPYSQLVHFSYNRDSRRFRRTRPAAPWDAAHGKDQPALTSQEFRRGAWPGSGSATTLGVMIPVSERHAFGGTPHYRDILELGSIAREIGHVRALDRRSLHLHGRK